MNRIESNNFLRRINAFETQENLSGLVIRHSELTSLVGLTRDFYSPEKMASGYLKKESVDVANILSGINGVLSVFSLGFPFYAIDSKGNQIAINEIDSFLEGIQNLIRSDEEKNPSGWECPSCQRVNLLPNINGFCKPCDKTVLKPRKIISAIPDLDVVALVEQPNCDTETEMRERLRENGYLQSDIDIYGSIIGTREAMSSFNQGRRTDYKIPIDLHIWSREDFNRGTDRLCWGETEVKIATRSLHEGWVDNELNFLFDFSFSLTPFWVRDPDTDDKLRSTRRNLSRRYGNAEIVKIIGEVSPRADRLMKCQSVKTVFLEKIEGWREYD